MSAESRVASDEARYLWVVNECAALAVGGQIASRCIFEAFDESLDSNQNRNAYEGTAVGDLPSFQSHCDPR